MSARFSCVTISYNQAQFLDAAMRSVLEQQDVELEYIVCDPGSTDGSRAMIEAIDDPRLVPVFEADNGPADGLNKGFSRATGDIYCYLNSDDLFLPGALATIDRWFDAHPEIDVVTGHAYAIDAEGRTLRRVWSEPFTPRSVAYGAHVQIQPSTFIRATAFRRTEGFDPLDRANWDGGLLVDLYRAGARISVIDRFLSCYRLHGDSITMSGRLLDRHRDNRRRAFRRLMQRDERAGDRMMAGAYRIAKHLRWPLRTWERIVRGPMLGRKD